MTLEIDPELQQTSELKEWFNKVGQNFLLAIVRPNVP